MTFEEWWESTGRAELYQDEPVIKEVAEAAWDAQQAIINAAPHSSPDCDLRYVQETESWVHQCNCWKAGTKKAPFDA
jgi:hypothetical protein